MSRPLSLRRRELLAAAVSVGAAGAPAWGASEPADQPGRMIVGSVDPKQVKGRRITLPRLHLYDAQHRLIERERWTAAMKPLRETAGDAFCCVSDTPQAPGASGPPPDCKVLVYGEDVNEHFVGLSDAAGRPIRLDDLPPHRFLLVDWYADWCAPCVPGRKALEAFLASPAGRDHVALVLDYTGLMPKAGAAAPARKT